MYFNLHTHTYRCNHASGCEKEYIENAIRNGIKILGFSDHAPYPFSNGHNSGFRMNVDKTEEYFKTIGNLKNEYKDSIKILIGFEAEYYPKHFNDFLNLIRPYNPDFLILGQHFMNNEYDGPYAGTPTDSEEILKLYVSQTIEALETGYFTYLAHPDLINFIGNTDIYQREMLKICDTAKKMDIPLEINLLGIIEKRHYPSERFFKIAAQNGNNAIFGADAHHPEYTYHYESIEKAVEFAQKNGIKILKDIPIRPVF